MFSGFQSDWTWNNGTSQRFHWYGENSTSPSNSPHNGAKLTSYKGDPFVAGGTWHRKTEKLSWTDSNGDRNVDAISGWEYLDDFPSIYRTSIYRYAAVSTGDAVYISSCSIDATLIPGWSNDNFQAESTNGNIDVGDEMCWWQLYKMLVTVLAILVTNIHYLFTLASRTNIEIQSSTPLSPNSYHKNIQNCRTGALHSWVMIHDKLQLFGGHWYQTMYGSNNFVARYENDAWDLIGPLFYGPRTYHGAFMISGSIFWASVRLLIRKSLSEVNLKMDFPKCIWNIDRRYKNASLGWIRSKLDVPKRGHW